MTVEDLREGQAFALRDEGALRGVYVLLSVSHDAADRYSGFKKLWLWHEDPSVCGFKSSGGAPWGSVWRDERLT